MIDKMYTFYCLFIVQSHKTLKFQHLLCTFFLAQNVSFSLTFFTYQLLTKFLKPFTYHLRLIFITFQNFFSTFSHLSPTLHYFLSMKNSFFCFCRCLALLISSTQSHNSNINNRFRMIPVRIIITKLTVIEIYINIIMG